MLNVKFTMEQIELIVHNEIANLLLENKIVVQKIYNEVKLNANLGLTSLDLARLVSLLEEKFRVDPFQEKFSITSIRTVGDLVNSYQQVIIN